MNRLLEYEKTYFQPSWPLSDAYRIAHSFLDVWQILQQFQNVYSSLLTLANKSSHYYTYTRVDFVYHKF